MSILLQPHIARPNQKLMPPPVVAVSKNALARNHPTDLLSVISLLNEDGSTSNAQDVITGNKSGTLQILDSGTAKEQPVYVFKDVSLKKSGKYRMRITMMKPEGSAYSVVESCTSGVVTVDTNTAIQSPENQALTSLRARGLRL